jgi:hypothetical protein
MKAQVSGSFTYSSIVSSRSWPAASFATRFCLAEPVLRH